MSTNGQEMQIFSILEQIEETVEESPKPKIGGGNKRVINADDIFDLLGDLKVTIPEDIRRANSVLVEADNITNNADEYARDMVDKAKGEAEGIVANAEKQAEDIIEQARAEYERMVSEEEVFKEAQRRAQLLAAKAEYNANTIYDNAKVYADEVLVDLQRFLAEYEQMIESNRRDLGARAQQPQPQIQPAAPAQPAAAPVRSARPAAQPAQEPKRPVKNMQPALDEDDDFEDEDDIDEEDDDRGSFLGLFKRRKKVVDDDDFLDEDF